MFLGTYFPRLDDKSRLILPARYREQLAEGLVITKGQERCLYVWPAADFDGIAESVRSRPATTIDERARARLFFAAASSEVPDKQGRVTVPASLREYAGLDRECVVLGASSRMEIWDADAWQAYVAEQESDYSGAPEGVIPGLV